MSQSGGGCRLNAGSGRCNKYKGKDDDMCILGDSHRCKFSSTKRPMMIRKARSPAQLANDFRLGQRSLKSALLLRELQTINVAGVN
jgi:hypothetical protein